MKKTFLFLLFLCVATVFGAREGRAEINFVTENTPPLNFMKDKKVVGITPDLILELMKDMGSPIKRSDFKMLTWADGYRMAQEEPGTALFSVARTQSRDPLFKWVGPVMTTTLAVLAPKSENIRIETAEDLQNYRIGTVRDTAPEQLLVNLYGVDDQALLKADDSVANIIGLTGGELDLVACNAPTFFYTVGENGLNPDDYEIVFVLMKAPLYIAFHKDTDATFIAKMNEKLRLLQTPGASAKSEYDKIEIKYVK